MKVICDAPGQTCNRLWSYVATIAECVIKKKKMMIIFFDYTVEDFPNFLHSSFIYFPLYHKKLLERGNNWNRYKSLLWKATHNVWLDRIYNFLCFVKGWHTRRDTRFIEIAKKEIIHILTPKKEIRQRVSDFINLIREKSDIVVGVHIRRGDYKTWHNGRFFFDLKQYASFMKSIVNLFPEKRVSFFICSNEWFELDLFQELSCFRYNKDQASAEIIDLYTLSECDYIIGPISTYSRWASFIGEKPLCFLESADQEIKKDSFSIITDFFHFSNGKEIEDW